MSVIKKPIITEKSLSLAQQGWYTFEVDPKATKGRIKEEIEKQFKVEVEKVRVLRRPPKPKRWGLHRGKTQEVRKALVKLRKGKIDLFELK